LVDFQEGRQNKTRITRMFADKKICINPRSKQSEKVL
jgi:hypothetical protein